MIADKSVTVLGGGYALSIGGKPRILVDMGNGTLERLGRSGLDISGVEHILLTRLDIDRTSDLPALIIRMYATGRTREVALTGPTGRPGAIEFVRLLFGSDGAWRYVNEFEGFGITALETPSAPSELSVYAIPDDSVLWQLGVSLYAVAVPHEGARTVAYRVDCDDDSIVFSGDFAEPTPPFLALARDCSVLAHDFTARRSAVGRLARESGARALLLSADSLATRPQLSEAIDAIRREYAGKIEVSGDLQTYEISP